MRPYLKLVGKSLARKCSQPMLPLPATSSAPLQRTARREQQQRRVGHVVLEDLQEARGERLVEDAPVERIFEAPSPPYTRGLLKALRASVVDSTAPAPAAVDRLDQQA